MAYYQSAAMEVDGEFLSCAHPPGSALCLPPPSFSSVTSSLDGGVVDFPHSILIFLTPVVAVQVDIAALTTCQVAFMLASFTTAPCIAVCCLMLRCSATSS